MTSTPAKRSLIADLKEYLALARMTSRAWLVFAVLGSVGLAALDTLGVAAMALLMQVFTDPASQGGVANFISQLFGGPSTSTLIMIIAIAIAGFFVTKSVGTVFFRWWLLGRTTRIAADASTELMRMFSLEPFARHRAREAVRIQRDVGSANDHAANVLLGVVGMLADLLVLVLLSVVLFVISPFVALFAAFLFGVVLMGTQRLLRARQTRIGIENAEAELNSLQYLIPALHGFKDVRLSGSAGAFADGYWKARMKLAHATRMLSITSELPRYLMEIVLLLAIGGIALILFATGTPDHAMSVLAVFGAAALRALPTLNRVGASLATVRSSRAGLTIVLTEAEELERGPRHNEIPLGDQNYSGDIVVDNVTLQYEDAERPVLDGISLVIPENSTVAITGSSGAGKSTLVDLILGMLRPTSGDITCGGRSISADIAAWYRELGVVAQDVYLLNDTLARNVAFGPPGTVANQTRLDRALKLAQLEDVVADLPEGTETVIGERGMRLSGGQRQRLGIARALYKEPRFLVLDEATSSLDNLTEHAISQLLKSLKGSMTVVIVAHRLSTVRDADKIVFLSDGQVQTEGTFAQVSERNEQFARLVELGKLS
ncbi:ABC-type multidrug transport system fused ATPase/permease subunit [Leucobacter exalbidus]|uniref:ABC-type multidrug transport system fused ATPase/permease subunit n=1 Tax=Leucobacter exalbidus TaxID=662960 RepID=A0A940T3J5_9MICO|nr:ABC transporter ATP-binding protein [Leucobacter exalbidus]MBP1326222.1 ABC-type multidrug transport system fused ATPase/permease subunit [Leucobacter exalbidus]